MFDFDSLEDAARQRCDFYKFRGFHNGALLYGDLLHRDRECYIVPQDATDSMDNYLVPWESVSMFTGMSDKNGKEIYERDFIMLENFGLVMVVYNRKRCSFELRVDLLDGGFIDNLKDFNIEKYEVVGNAIEDCHYFKRMKNNRGL